MSESLAQTINARLGRYLRNEESLAEFEAWLVPETWDLSPQSDPAAHALATGITLRIAEFTSGDWTEEELRATLRQLQQPPVQIVPSGVAKGAVFSSEEQDSFSAADKALSGAFG